MSTVARGFTIYPPDCTLRAAIRFACSHSKLLILLTFFGAFYSCERPHSVAQPLQLPLWSILNRGNAVSTEKTFDDLIVLEKDAFDPDAVFLDDIVDDEVLPRLSLAVDGLTGTLERKRPAMELRPEDVVEDTPGADTTMPVAALNPELLEVYGWESSLWRKIKGYVGF